MLHYISTPSISSGPLLLNLPNSFHLECFSIIYPNPEDNTIFPQKKGLSSRFLRKASLIWKAFISVYLRYFTNNIGTPNSHIVVVTAVVHGTPTHVLKASVKAQRYSQTAAMAGTDFQEQKPQVVCDLSKW